MWYRRDELKVLITVVNKLQIRKRDKLIQRESIKVTNVRLRIIIILTKTVNIMPLVKKPTPNLTILKTMPPTINKFTSRPHPLTKPKTNLPINLNHSKQNNLAIPSKPPINPLQSLGLKQQTTLIIWIKPPISIIVEEKN